MYETERNRHRMARVRFLTPVQLVRGTPPQQQIGNPKYIKPGAEKSPTALHKPMTPDYVGGALGVGINGTATNGGSMVSPPLPTSAPSSNGHHDNDTSSSTHVQSASPPYHHPIKQSTSPTHHAADPISPTSASVTSGGFAKPSPVVVGTNNSTTASGKSFYFVL